MAAISSTGPTITERPEEEAAAIEAAATDVEVIDKKLEGLAIKSGVTSRKKQRSQPTATNLFIQSAPYVNIHSPILAAPPNERSYLLENRQRQHDRGQRLSDALQIIETRIVSAQSKTDGRKLRKEAGLLKKKISESLKQEQLITLRLNDIQTEDFNRNPYWQAPPWSPYSPMTPWSNMTSPMMSPMHGPVSPLTPLLPGLYHPSPVMPGPLTSLYWLNGPYQYQTMAPPYMQTDEAYYLGMDFPQPFVPQEFIAGQPSRNQSMAMPTVAKKLRERKHKGANSVDFKLQHEDAYRGRRWSLADTFSPTPRDKRMSMPGLETIWKDDNEKEKDE